MNGSHFKNKALDKKPGPHFERRLCAAFVKAAPPGRRTDGGGLYLAVDQTGAWRRLLRIALIATRLSWDSVEPLIFAFWTKKRKNRAFPPDCYFVLAEWRF